MASGHRWNSVGDECARVLIAAYQVNGEVHWPTVISATAALSGEMALVANEPRLPEFGVVESRRVAQFLHDGDAKNRTLWGYSTTIAREAFDVEVENLPSYASIVEQLGVQLLHGSFPALSVAAHLMPRETPLNAGPRHRKAMHIIAGNAGLGTNDTSFALATAAMKMIGAVQSLGARDLTILALQSGVAGSRFVPLYEPALNPAQSSVNAVFGSDDDEVAEAPSVEAPAPVPAPTQAPTPSPTATADAVAAALGTLETSGFGRRHAAGAR